MNPFPSIYIDDMNLTIGEGTSQDVTSDKGKPELS
jgi:hypothetical protein